MLQVYVIYQISMLNSIYQPSRWSARVAISVTTAPVTGAASKFAGPKLTLRPFTLLEPFTVIFVLNHHFEGLRVRLRVKGAHWPLRRAGAHGRLPLRHYWHWRSRVAVMVPDSSGGDRDRHGVWLRPGLEAGRPGPGIGFEHSDQSASSAEAAEPARACREFRRPTWPARCILTRLPRLATGRAAVTNGHLHRMFCLTPGFS